MIKIKIRSGQATQNYRDGTSKADIARDLLDKGYKANEISKAVPMAYSQVHSIAAKTKGPPKIPAAAKKPIAPISSYEGGKRPTSKARVVEAKAWAGKKVDKLIDEAATGRAAEQRAMHGGHKSSINGKKIGPCANCGFELLAAKLGGQMQMIHTGGTVEDYLDVIQFCHAYPASLPVLR